VTKIAIIGAHGQLGSDLCRLWKDRAAALTHADIEITDPDSIAVALDPVAPQYVVNTAAYNAVDRAEQDPRTAFAVNALGPLYLARYCDARGIALLHVSTDYVFGADPRHSTPWTEQDLPGPVSVYGCSKLAGEHLVGQACRRHFVVRTCGLYGTAIDESKGNFVRTMLRLAGERDELKVVNDQHCTPSFTVDVARAIDALLATDEYGLYHVTSAGRTTWYELACTIFALSGRDVRVLPITTAEFAAPAARPAFSVLDCRRLADATGVTLRPWQDALADYLSQIAPVTG
jgi:dTDP-4-dehydrorhamnose reductase